MAEQTRDELAADILKSVRESYKNRSPRAIARDEVGYAFRAAKDAIPERERILTNARKYTREDYVAGWQELNLIAQKSGKLDDDEKDELQRLRHQWAEDSPYNQPPDVKVSLVGEGIPHLDFFVQEWLWDNLWWAAYQGQTVEEYISGLRTSTFGPLFRVAIRNSPPMPEGYVVTTRRNS